MTDPQAIRPLEQRPDADVVVPGSKSHTNRALVCAALAEGRSRLSGALFAEDTEAMLGALRTLNIGVSADPDTTTVLVDGCDGRLMVDGPTLDVRQSGTTGRFLLPTLALATGVSVLDGDPQLRSRPFGDLVDALAQLGVEASGATLPIEVRGGTFRGGAVTVAGAVSSQFLSGLLLNAPCADSAIEITVLGELVSVPYVDLTLSTMAAFGAEVVNRDHQQFVVEPSGYRGADVLIEPDASAASYFFGAAAVTGGRVRIGGLGNDTVQGDLAFVDVLEQMGAIVRRGPVSTEVTGPAQLTGVDVDLADFSDTAQTLAVVASFASSPTRVRGIGFIRHKETDRIGAVTTELRRCGIKVDEHDDGFTVYPGSPTAGVVHTYDDHRMAMSFSLLGLVYPGIEIADPGCVAKTFPTFFAALEQLRLP
jgi:3-phosphoshikimate 1-carboxyvinyltransferase